MALIASRERSQGRRGRTGRRLLRPWRHRLKFPSVSPSKSIGSRRLAPQHSNAKPLSVSADHAMTALPSPIMMKLLDLLDVRLSAPRPTGQRFHPVSGGEALTTYRFASRTAAHRFCANCGIKSFYIPRADPFSRSVNARCLDVGVRVQTPLLYHSTASDGGEQVIGCDRLGRAGACGMCPIDVSVHRCLYLGLLTAAANPARRPSARIDRLRPSSVWIVAVAGERACLVADG